MVSIAYTCQSQSPNSFHFSHLFSFVSIRLFSTSAYLFLLCKLLLFSHSVMSNSLRPHELQHTRFPCPSPSPGVCSNSRPLNQWCHPTISSSVIPFSCLQSFPASGSFPTSQLFASDGQSIGASASASVLPINVCKTVSIMPVP